MSGDAKAIAIQLLEDFRRFGHLDHMQSVDVAVVLEAFLEDVPAPESPQPMQPLVWEEDVIRFKPNEIVRRLLDEGGIDLNQIALWKVSDEDRTQFTQLIGYSVSGAGDLSYFNRDTLAVADAIAESMSRAKRST